MEVTFNWEAFISVLAHSPNLSSSGPSGAVYELLRDFFILNDSTNGFNLFFDI
jgi:hypothetical protein